MKSRTFSGARLRGLREGAGFTQEELAAISDIGVSTLRNYETGRSQPKADRLAKLAMNLGCKTEALYEGVT